MKWTERCMAMKANGITRQDLMDAEDPQSCLVAEAGKLLGVFWENELLKDRVNYGKASRLIDTVIDLDTAVGGRFPSTLLDRDIDQAIELCLKVEDAVLRLKREGWSPAIADAELKGYDEA